MRAITAAAAVIALVVALAGPLSYLWLSWRAQLQDTSITARLHATFITQAINLGSDNWRADVDGLLDADLVPQPLPEARSIADLDGRTVTRTQTELKPPLLEARAPLLSPGGLVAHVVIARSMRPLLHSAGWVALVSALLGAAIYLTLRVLPMRALSRAMQALAHEQERSRRDLEQYVHVLFDRAVEGIVTIDSTGTVRSCNPSAAAMFGMLAPQVVGRPLAELVDPPGGVRPSFPEGASETAARRLEGSDVLSFPCELTVSLLSGAEHDGKYLCTLRDLTERRVAEQRMSRLANYDSLTGLPNRSLFRDRLVLAMQRADRSGRQMALMFLDLDRFKTINDSLGHNAGDLLLQHVAQAITESLRSTDTVGRVQHDNAFTVARLGGDEFTVIAEDLHGPEQAAQIAQRIQRALEVPFYAGTEEIVVTTSLGITLYPDDPSPLDELLTHADMAMYRAKELGRAGYQFYSAALHAAADQRLQLEARLRHALERDEFKLVFQPKASLATGRVTGVEALLRWQRNDEAQATPDQFIGVLEETGLILPVGAWVLEQAICQVQRWQELGLPALRLAVNLSARQLRHGEIVETVAAVLQRSGLPPHQLELELTESMLMDGDSNARTLQRLAELGVQLAIDDFGTGYSSLSYLKRFNVDTLKIDRSFVRDTPDDAEDSAIVTAIIALGRSLNLRVVAEGVETREQMELLSNAGCDEMQGYWLSPPLPPQELALWLSAREGTGYDCPTTEAVATSSSNSASAACPLIA